MKLSNGNNAIVEIRKLREYCLNPDNPRGANKARVFASALGITMDDAESLKGILLDAARESETEIGELDDYGQRYTIDFEMATAFGTAPIRSGWIILHEEERPRLATCFVVKKKWRKS